MSKTRTDTYSVVILNKLHADGSWEAIHGDNIYKMKLSEYVIEFNTMNNIATCLLSHIIIPGKTIVVKLLARYSDGYVVDIDIYGEKLIQERYNRGDTLLEHLAINYSEQLKYKIIWDDEQDVSGSEYYYRLS